MHKKQDDQGLFYEYPDHPVKNNILYDHPFLFTIALFRY